MKYNSQYGVLVTVLLTVTVLLSVLLSAGCVEKTSKDATVSQDQFRSVVDSRGVTVKIPTNIEKVATISDGLIEGVMTSIGVQDTLVGLGSSCLQRNFNYTYDTVGGETFTYENGMNPVTYLNPWIMDLPIFAQSSSAVNYETLASLDPDVVIVRLGSCTLRFIDDESTQKSIETIESLGIPLIVLYGSSCYDDPDVSKISDEIYIIGQVFDRGEEAASLAEYLETQVNYIDKQKKNISGEQQPDVLVFGASPKARSASGAGQVFGLDTIESYFIQDLVHARNSFQEPGYFKIVSAEQLLALNPDVIVLCTASGYHPPLELYEAPYYQNLQELDAIKNKRVASLPWSPCNCAKRLEYPIDVMVIAKTAYPEYYKEINLAEWLLDFYQNVYGVERDTAKELRSTQWMDWTMDSCSNCD